MSNELKEFKIFLPLYDSVKNIEIGIDSSSSIEKAINNDKQPIVFMELALHKEAVLLDLEWRIQT